MFTAVIVDFGRVIVAVIVRLSWLSSVCTNRRLNSTNIFLGNVREAGGYRKDSQDLGISTSVNFMEISGTRRDFKVLV